MGCWGSVLGIFWCVKILILIYPVFGRDGSCPRVLLIQIDNSGLAVAAMWWLSHVFFCFGCIDIALAKLGRTSAFNLTVPYVTLIAFIPPGHPQEEAKAILQSVFVCVSGN
jgi:hypothetical protein